MTVPGVYTPSQDGQARLDATHGACRHCGAPIGYHEREALQDPYRSLWQAICAKVIGMDPDVPIVQHALAKVLDDLWAEVPAPAKVVAVNTTRYDRPLDELTEWVQRGQECGQ